MAAKKHFDLQCAPVRQRLRQNKDSNVPLAFAPSGGPTGLRIAINREVSADVRPEVVLRITVRCAGEFNRLQFWTVVSHIVARCPRDFQSLTDFASGITFDDGIQQLAKVASGAVGNRRLTRDAAAVNRCEARPDT